MTDYYNLRSRVRVMVFNTTFNNISAILWQRKADYPKKTIDLLQVNDKLSHKVVSSTPHHERHNIAEINQSITSL